MPGNHRHRRLIAGDLARCGAHRQGIRIHPTPISRHQKAVVLNHACRVENLGKASLINLKDSLATALLEENKFCAEDLREALTILEAIVPMSRRLLGGSHPYTKRQEVNLTMARVRGTFMFPKEG